jgi:integrase
MSGRDPVSGKYRQLSRTVRGSKTQAQQALNKYVAEAQAGRYDGTSSTFGELVVEWLTLKRDQLSPTTFRTYRNLLKNHILPGLGDRPVHAIKASDLDSLYLGLRKKVLPSGKVGLSLASVRQIHAIIRSAFNQAIKWGWVVTNPAANATPPRLVKSTISPPSAAQLDEILRAADERDPELGHFFHIAASTGARRGEICALHWGNLDTKRKTLTIEGSIAEITGGLKEKDTKTHAKRRIALDRETLEVFEAQRAIATERAAQVGMKVIPDAFVFSREPDGRRPWTPGNVTNQFQAIRDSLGFTKVRLHDLRHFSVTRLMAAGIDVRTISGRHGHANASTTLSVYAHFVEASDQNAAAKMGNLRSQPRKKPVAKKIEPAARVEKAVKNAQTTAGGKTVKKAQPVASATRASKATKKARGN